MVPLPRADAQGRKGAAASPPPWSESEVEEGHCPKDGSGGAPRGGLASGSVRNGTASGEASVVLASVGGATRRLAVCRIAAPLPGPGRRRRDPKRKGGAGQADRAPDPNPRQLLTRFSHCRIQCFQDVAPQSVFSAKLPPVSGLPETT